MLVMVIGYVVLGVILGIGIFVLLVVFDNKLVDGILVLIGWDLGLMLMGMVVVLVIVYVVWFFVIV